MADTLARDAGVPFRTAHAYASALTDHCRAQGIRTAALTDSDLIRIYQETTGSELPVEPRVIHEALDPAAMIQNRKGFGGPQPDEMQRSLERHRSELANDREWLDQAQSQLLAARLQLHASFLALEANSSTQR